MHGGSHNIICQEPSPVPPTTSEASIEYGEDEDIIEVGGNAVDGRYTGRSRTSTSEMRQQGKKVSKECVFVCPEWIDVEIALVFV